MEEETETALGTAGESGLGHHCWCEAETGSAKSKPRSGDHADTGREEGAVLS